MTIKSLGWIIGAACAAMLACGQQEETAAKPEVIATAAAPKTPAVSQASLEEAKQVFASRCVACHGVSGAGNGPQSNDLVPRPRNFQDPEWQRSVTDSYLERIIVEGGAAVGKSAAMPPNPDLAGKPEVVAALRSLLRSLKD